MRGTRWRRREKRFDKAESSEMMSRWVAVGEGESVANVEISS